MKHFLFTIILSCLGLTGFSQGLPTFKLGVKGGMNLSKFKTSDPFDSENRSGYYAGIWARIGGAGIHLQPELYLSGKNAKLIGTNGQENNVKFTSLDLPILIGTKIGAAGFGLRLNTGPVFTFLLDENQKFGEATASAFDGKFKDKTLAWQFGVGLDLGKLNIDGRYESGLSKVNSAGGYPTTKLNLYTIGIGFSFF